jgi:hypothetical protein
MAGFHWRGLPEQRETNLIAPIARDLYENCVLVANTYELADLIQ